MKKGFKLFMTKLFVVFLAILMTGMVSAAGAEDERPQFTSEFGMLPRITYNGQTYAVKANLTTVLLLGYDMPNDKVKPAGYRGGGQSDFVFLVVIDHHDKKVYQLQFDRDMMWDITVLGLTGKDVGKQNMQLCLAHAYGADIFGCDAHVRETIEDILYGVSIDGTISMRMGLVDRLNNALGGVRVNVEEEINALGTTIPQGEVVLTDEQAKAFVRARMGVGDGKNESRMRRQKEFIKSAYATLREKMAANSGFAKQLLEVMSEVTDSTFSNAQLINELNKAITYELVPVYNFAGEHYIGRHNYMEFHADEESIMAFVLDAFCNPVE